MTYFIFQGGFYVMHEIYALLGSIEMNIYAVLVIFILRRDHCMKCIYRFEKSKTFSIFLMCIECVSNKKIEKDLGKNKCI